MRWRSKTDGAFFQAFGPATTSAFRLAGGEYGVTTGTGTGTAQLQRVLADGTNVNVNGTAFTANSYNVVNIPPRLYQIVIATAAVDVAVTRVHQF